MLRILNISCGNRRHLNKGLGGGNCSFNWSLRVSHNTVMLQEDSNANWAEMICRALIYTRAARDWRE